MALGRAEGGGGARDRQMGPAVPGEWEGGQRIRTTAEEKQETDGKEAREKKQAGSRSCWHVWRGFVSYFDAASKMRTIATSALMKENMNLHRLDHWHALSS
jgi:hypothetical protein